MANLKDNSLQLIVGNSSTWSMRAWIGLKLAGFQFEQIVIALDAPDYQQTLTKYSGTLKVPVLFVDGFKIHDSLAIVEYANECSHGNLYPADPMERALARSLCAELHTGFNTLRDVCPFILDQQSTTPVHASLENELKRLTSIFENCRGDFMFEKPGIVDGFYAVMAYRLNSYQIRLTGRAQMYQQSLLQWPLFLQALETARGWESEKI